jgi:hypothetical protein
VVSGFVSTVKKWVRFEIAWNAILSNDGVSAFHMTDYVSSKGEFASWKGDSARRKQHSHPNCRESPSRTPTRANQHFDSVRDCSDS